MAERTASAPTAANCSALAQLSWQPVRTSSLTCRRLPLRLILTSSRFTRADTAGRHSFPLVAYWSSARVTRVRRSHWSLPRLDGGSCYPDERPARYHAASSVEIST